MVEWLINLSGNAGDAHSIPGQETKIPHAVEPNGKKHVKRKRRERTSEDENSINGEEKIFEELMIENFL